MCGIAGIIGKRAVNPLAIKAMTDMMSHRGPDGEGVWISEDGGTVFGHRRLAIIDPTPAGAQPMRDVSGQFVITFNGEIYNHIELAQRLRDEGVSFRSKCDTEVVLEAYKAWGAKCVDQFNGMFAFAIHDARTGQIFCARDRFGEKPFLYVETPEFFAFASEYKALFCLQGVDAEIDDLALLRFLHQPRQGLDDGRTTMFPSIRQLLPAESLIFNPKSMNSTTTRYWDVHADADLGKMSEPDAVVRFHELLKDSVRIRMRSDVPVGSCLSGGLDSSSIVCLNREILGPHVPYQTFTGNFPGSPMDEATYAEVVRQAAGVSGHDVSPDAGRFEDELPELVWFNELPFGSASQFAQWSVFRLARECGVTVLLDGQGADELLGGYEQYYTPYLTALSQVRPAAEVAAEHRRIAARYPMAFSGRPAGLTGNLPVAVRHRLANWSGRGSDFLFGLTREMAVKVSTDNQRQLDESFNPLSRVLKDDCLHAHLPTLLRYGDRNSMAHSREVRLPFCDHRLAEFVLSLKPQILMGEAETKHLLRAAMADVLPDQIVRRWNKQGFLPPQDDWFRGPLLPLLHATLASAEFSSRGYWNKPWWDSLLRRFEAGERHLTWMLWRPLMAEAWHRHFVRRIAGLPRVAVFQ